MAELLTTENLIALLTLTSLEVVLGIDNIVFLSILCGKLPPERQPFARRLGLLLAMGMRILLLLAISWVMGLVRPLFEILGHEFSGRDLILLGGGAFLIAKATFEIHEKMEVSEREARLPMGRAGILAVLVQIALLDVVFSLDSVITAVGMVDHVPIMILAIVIAIGVMMAFAGAVSRFIDRHPTMKVLALSFLILVGVMLVAEGFGKHIEKGYIYFAMAFSLGVEFLNMRLRGPAEPAPGH